MKKAFRILSIEAENLRGYQYTKLSLKKLSILVGENNEGKSSLLKMFDYLLRSPIQFWDGDRVLSLEDYNFWYPANSQNHKARRFTINIEMLDGNFARRYKASKDDELALRFAVRSSDGECRINIGPPRRGEVHDHKGVELLQQIKNSTMLMLLPPVRDASSSSFANKVTASVSQKIIKKLNHARQAGAPREYRLAKEIVEKVRDIFDLSKENVSGHSHSPLSGMMRSNEVRIDLKPSDISDLIKDKLYLYVSTGDHDERMVLPGETGNGLQSLIDIDLSLASLMKERTAQEIILIVEEPEAFLHPSAQRQFMRYLRHALEGRIDRVVLTTHSPIIVDEAKYEEVVLVRSQKHYESKVTDVQRSEINTSLMSVANSEVFFARTVVLVEGESDKALLGTLLRRISNHLGIIDNFSGVVIQATGSCTSFAPWLRLIDSYEKAGVAPFKSLWLMDADADAAATSTSRALIQATTDSGRTLKSDERDAVIKFGDLAWHEDLRNVQSTQVINRALSGAKGRVFSCDLEWAIFNGASSGSDSATREALKRCKVNSDGNSVVLARRLGSKISTGQASSGAAKSPYIRAAIAEVIPLKEIPPEIHAVLFAIVELSLGDRKLALGVFNKLLK